MAEGLLFDAKLHTAVNKVWRRGKEEEAKQKDNRVAMMLPVKTLTHIQSRELLHCVTSPPLCLVGGGAEGGRRVHFTERKCLFDFVLFYLILSYFLVHFFFLNSILIFIFFYFNMQRPFLPVLAPPSRKFVFRHVVRVTHCRL